MKLGVLFSGGKDSVLAMHKAKEHHDIVCLLNLVSENPDSFMFHTPNANLTKLQSDSLGIPLLSVTTKGEKEKELDDMRSLLSDAKKKFKIEGVVTGAINSVYQATRIQTVCDELGLWCFNPLWQMDQIELLNEIVADFEVIIVQVSAFPFDEKWLGRKIDEKTVAELKSLAIKHKINPAGEGGEIETFVLNAPLFKKKIAINNAKTTYGNYAGRYIIGEAVLK